MLHTLRQVTQRVAEHMNQASTPCLHLTRVLHCRRISLQQTQLHRLLAMMMEARPH